MRACVRVCVSERERAVKVWGGKGKSGGLNRVRKARTERGSIRLVDCYVCSIDHGVEGKCKLQVSRFVWRYMGETLRTQRTDPLLGC